jgi:peptidoglycan/xylan/chitin deacetylase (PgdA/CDA1 family)
MKSQIRKIYMTTRKASPVWLNSFLTKQAFLLSGKPFVKKDGIDPAKKFPGGQKGGFIISADFEMSWAFRFSKKNKNYLELGRHERENFPKIIALLEKYNIPVTWATVGHLFLESCSKGDHDWMARIPHFDDHWKFTQGDWFDHDPYTDHHKDPEWYAPDLIEQIIQSPVPHEIGCHTFSHMDCTYKNCPPLVLDDELKACTLAAEKLGIKLTSLVFPGGTAGNYEILKKHGYRIYRKNIDVDLAYPFRDEFGMMITPTSGSFGDNGLGWSSSYFIYRYKKIIDRAIKTSTVAHFWFHPSIDTWSLEQVMPEVLKYADQKQEEGKLWIGTMGEMADHIEKNKLL